MTNTYDLAAKYLSVKKEAEKLKKELDKLKISIMTEVNPNKLPKHSVELEGEHTNIEVAITTVTSTRWNTDAMVKAIAEMMNTSEERVEYLYKTNTSTSERLNVKMVPK